MPLRIHPGGAAGNHSGTLKSLHAQVGTGPGDVQASRQCPDGNATVLAQHRHDSPVDIIERRRLRSGAGRSGAVTFAGPRCHDVNLPRS